MYWEGQSCLVFAHRLVSFTITPVNLSVFCFTRHVFIGAGYLSAMVSFPVWSVSKFDLLLGFPYFYLIPAGIVVFYSIIVYRFLIKYNLVFEKKIFFVLGLWVLNRQIFVFGQIFAACTRVWLGILRGFFSSWIVLTLHSMNFKFQLKNIYIIVVM